MKRARIGVSCWVGVCVFSSWSIAVAEPSASPSAVNSSSVSSPNEDTLGSLFYEFDDDALNALGHGAQGMLLRVRPEAARVVLLRPRVQFVSELLQSVEAL